MGLHLSGDDNSGNFSIFFIIIAVWLNTNNVSNNGL